MASFPRQIEHSLQHLRIVLCEISASSLHVIDYEFVAGADRALRDEAKAALRPLVLPHLEFMQVLKRSSPYEPESPVQR